jgi:hypothetical protein
MSDRTQVVFRKWRPSHGSSVIALLPQEQSSEHYCSSYEHVGQHGGADYDGVMRMTRPATMKEYADLKAELEGAPYHYVLDIRRRAVPFFRGHRGWNLNPLKSL